MKYKVIKNELDSRYKVVEVGNEKGTAFGDSEDLIEALDSASVILDIKIDDIDISEV